MRNQIPSYLASYICRSQCMLSQPILAEFILYPKLYESIIDYFVLNLFVKIYLVYQAIIAAKMIKNIFSLNKPLNRIIYKFGYISQMFNIQNRQSLIHPKITKSIPSSIDQNQEEELRLAKKQMQQRNSHIEPTIIPEGQQEEKQHREQEVSQEEDGEIQEVVSVEQKNIQQYLASFKKQVEALVQEGKLENLDKLIRTYTKILQDKPFSEKNLIDYFAQVRSLRFRITNKLIISNQTQQILKSFITHKKLSKTLNNITKNWQTYNKELLLKMTSLYRYLPQQVIVSSLKKLFSLFQNQSAGYSKHLQIMHQILERKQKVELGQLNHTLIMNGLILYKLFRNNFGDFEMVMRFIQTYNAFAGSKILGGLVFYYISFIVKPERKGYVFDYELLRQAFSTYYACVNSRSKIKIKFIDQMPNHIRTALQSSSPPNVGDLLDGFFSLSNFSNCNQYFSRIITDTIKEASESDIKANTQRIHLFLNYLLHSLKPQYSLSSLELPNCNPITQNTIGSIRTLLPIVIDTFLLQFLSFDFDPYVYKLLFTNQSEFSIILDKCLHLLGNPRIDPLPILKLFFKNFSLIQSFKEKIRPVVEQAWKSLDKNHLQWPKCVQYFYYFSFFQKKFDAKMKNLNSKIQNLITKIKKQDRENFKKPKKLWPILTSLIESTQYLLPTLLQNDPKIIEDQVLQSFTSVQLSQTIRNWNVLQFCLNLKVVAQYYKKLPHSFTKAMLQNLSILTMVHGQTTVVHPDIDVSVIQKLVTMILENYYSLKLHAMDIKVFQMLCILVPHVIDTNSKIKNLLSILGFKQQKYIPEMVKFLQNYQFEDKNSLSEIIQLFPPTFKNVQIDKESPSKSYSDIHQEKNQREIRKYLTIVLDNPSMRMNQQLSYKNMKEKQEKILYLCNKYYEAILKINAQQELQQIESSIMALFPPKTKNLSSKITSSQEQSMDVYEQFDISQKSIPNHKFQLLKVEDIDAEQFQTVQLLEYPIEQEILLNLSNESYLQNQILSKLNDDINPAYNNLRYWFQRMGINSKVRNNLLNIRGRQKKSWNKSNYLIISKPQTFKLNIIIAYVLNKKSDIEFVVIEEQSNVENAIKNFIYKKHNLI